ncbi:MAG: DinB family protein [Rhodothermales bacterium]|nr:DinB family protein [Rhodothermales bacterium]
MSQHPATPHALLDHIAPPAPGDYSPFLAAYIARAREAEWSSILLAKNPAACHLARGLTELQGDIRYGEGKWSIREILGHLSDTERVFSYRAMCIARGETGPLPSFDQDLYVRNAGFETRTLVSLADEFEAVRGATRALVASLSDEALARRGTASNHPVTPAALIYAIAGHEVHHMILFRDRLGLTF